MAKWYGKVGFISTEETAPGVWEPVVTERNYTGDILKVNTRWQQADKLNDDFTISNRISFIADGFANENFYSIKYASFMGTLWKVTDVEVAFPRLNLSLGGVYNGEQA